MILRALSHMLSPGGERGRLSTLIFHRVLPRPDPLFPGEPDAGRFDEILTWIGRWFNVLPLDQAVDGLISGNLPPRALSITFDDGYADNATVALPILQRHRMTATFFVATAFLDGGCMWNDTLIEAIRNHSQSTIDLRELGLGQYSAQTIAERRTAIDSLLGQIKYQNPEIRQRTVAAIAGALKGELPSDLMMSTRQIVGLRDAGMQIGAHTRSHPILASLSDEAAWAEMEGSKRDLEHILGEAVTLFAYPNGRPSRDYLAKHAEMARKIGFVAAVSTAPGVSTSDTPPYQLPRFTPWDRQSTRFAARMLFNLMHTATDQA